MRFSRPPFPCAISTAAGATPRIAARVRVSSRFASPSTGRAPTRTQSAPPWNPANPGRPDPGRTWTRRCAPSVVEVTQSSGSTDTNARDDGPDQQAPRERVEAPDDHPVDHLDQHDDDERREVDARRIHEGEAATNLGQYGRRGPMEELDNRVAWIGTHPRDEGGGDQYPEVHLQERMKHVRDRARELPQDDRSHLR